jgi:preprotein translocase subunit SecD
MLEVGAECFIHHLTGRGRAPAVDIRLNAVGTRALADYSTSHIDEQIVIMLDDTVFSCPKIVSEITADSLLLSGNCDKEQAAVLAAVLRGGALPVHVMTVEAP